MAKKFHGEKTHMLTIMVMNSKGGSGKTTIATNLAGHYASVNTNVVLKDYDPQGSSTEWLKQRPFALPKIHNLAAYKSSSLHVTRSWQMRLPSQTERLIIDTPAGVNITQFMSIIRTADRIIIPVSPSSIDIRATMMFIHELKKQLKLNPCKAEVGIVANRADKDSSAYQSLIKLLNNLDLAVVTSFSQNENYIRAAERGVSLLELDHPMVMKDKDEWTPLIQWLDGNSAEPNIGLANKTYRYSQNDRAIAS